MGRDGVQGLLLAAGAGRRMGRPKALVRDPDGTPWLARSVGVLLDGGCAQVTVVLGASGPEAELPLEHTEYVHCPQWDEGIGASLAFGLRHLEGAAAVAALIHLVDLPDVGALVAQRILSGQVGEGSLRRAVYEGRAGHPALIGRAHWAPLVAELSGDRGAGPYLRRRAAEEIECGDLATGRDVDHPQGESGESGQ